MESGSGGKGDDRACGTAMSGGDTIGTTGGALICLGLDGGIRGSEGSGVADGTGPVGMYGPGVDGDRLGGKEVRGTITGTPGIGSADLGGTALGAFGGGVINASGIRSATGGLADGDEAVGCNTMPGLPVLGTAGASMGGATC